MYSAQNTTQKLILHLTGRWLINQIGKPNRRGDGGTEQDRDEAEQRAFLNLFPELICWEAREKRLSTGAAHPSHPTHSQVFILSCSQPVWSLPSLSAARAHGGAGRGSVPVSPAQHPPAPAAALEALKCQGEDLSWKSAARDYVKLQPGVYLPYQKYNPSPCQSKQYL